MTYTYNLKFAKYLLKNKIKYLGVADLLVKTIYTLSSKRTHHTPAKTGSSKQYPDLGEPASNSNVTQSDA